MSTKKISLDILGETHIPEDLLTPSLGSNYGLDGFEDLQYGAGVLEGIEDPSLMPPPATPTGLVKGGGEGMDLTAMLQESSLADLDWLDPTQLQDLDRLPKNPVNQSIPELEKAWGVENRTDGISVVALDLERARYEGSLNHTSPSKKASAQQMMSVITHAMRRSTAHHDIDTVIREAMDSMGEEMGRVASALKEVKKDHGLAGNVFVRSTAFPGYSTGKWATFIKKHASGAKYLIVSDEDLRQATWIQQGRCAYTGKLAVTEIPWKDAFQHYAPILALGGRKASGSDPREALRVGFLSLPEKRAADSNLPTHKVPLDKMSSEEARKILSETKVDRKVYSEQGNRVARGVAKISSAIKQGTSGKLLNSLIRQTFLDQDLRLAVKQLAPLLKNALDESQSTTTQFSGPEFRAHSMTRSASMGNPEAHIMSGPAMGALRRIRRAMSEGFAGKPLEEFIQMRFSNSLLSEIGDHVSDLRNAHEGGSGFVYVDASAYASPTGITGCEEGALRHRSNQIPAVAAMDKCGSCSMSRAREDGTKKCSVYNKALLEDTSGSGMTSLRQANIRVANMSEAEQTAAMFASPENAYHASEYGLRNATMDVEMEALPGPDKMDISFGGWDL